MSYGADSVERFCGIESAGICAAASGDSVAREMAVDSSSAAMRFAFMESRGLGVNPKIRAIKLIFIIMKQNKLEGSESAPFVKSIVILTSDSKDISLNLH